MSSSDSALSSTHAVILIEAKDLVCVIMTPANLAQFDGTRLHPYVLKLSPKRENPAVSRCMLLT
jgi:hypothetical protein